jgi:hypothetical protein
VILANPEFDTQPSSEQQAAVGAWLSAAATDECFAVRRTANRRGEVDFDVWLVFREFVCVAPDAGRVTVAVVGFD